MNDIARDLIAEHGGSCPKAINRCNSGPTPIFEAPFGGVSRAQDAPRAWIASNCLLAMTRLARPNRLNSCAWFLAKPL